MSKHRISKITRQLQLYDTVISIKNDAIYSPAELMETFDISLRMLQRDLKDLRDCGLINLKYNRAENRYVIAGDSVFDENAGVQRKHHLIRLYRIGTLIHSLSCIDPNELERYEWGLNEYNEYLKEAEADPDNNSPEDIEGMREFYVPDIEFSNLKSEYYELFPESNERTRQRDFREMCRAGFEIYYSRKYHTFIYLYPM